MDKRKIKIALICFIILVAFSTLFIKLKFKKDKLYKYQWALKNDKIFHAPNELINTTKSINIASVSFVDIYGNENSKENTISNSLNIDIKYEEARKLFNKQKDKHDILIALIDTGVDINHYELKDSVFKNKKEIPNNNIDDDKNGYIDDYNGWNFVDNNNVIFDDEISNIHGTHAMGTMVAKIGNGGIKGIAYNKHIKVLPIKVLDGTLSGKTSNLVKAIDYALSFKADIINISLGTRTYNQNLDEIIREHKDTTFVLAAGNSTNGTNIDNDMIYPASFNYDNVITVGNLDFNANKFITSNYGKNCVTIFAPGTFILSTAPKNTFAYFTGSSMASPIVSASIAMMQSVNYELGPFRVKEILKKTATHIDNLNELDSCNGYLNLYAALYESIYGGK